MSASTSAPRQQGTVSEVSPRCHRLAARLLPRRDRLRHPRQLLRAARDCVPTAAAGTGALGGGTCVSLPAGPRGRGCSTSRLANLWMSEGSGSTGVSRGALVINAIINGVLGVIGSAKALAAALGLGGTMTSAWSL